SSRAVAFSPATVSATVPARNSRLSRPGLSAMRVVPSAHRERRAGGREGSLSRRPARRPALEVAKADVIVAPVLADQRVRRHWPNSGRRSGAWYWNARRTYLYKDKEGIPIYKQKPWPASRFRRSRRARMAQRGRGQKWPNRSSNGRSRIATWGRSVTSTTARRR